ncbi:MAG: PEGA domain-containing protein, partial [Candidatus Hydrothermarchaeota archaeon]
YKDYIKEITVKSGEEVYEVAVLTPKSGKIVVSSDPSDASVYLNDNYKGKTPLELSIQPGNYIIKLTKEGYKDYIKEITVKSGEEVYENATLVSTSVTTKKPLDYLLIALFCFGILSLAVIGVYWKKISIGRRRRMYPRRWK